MKTRGPDVGLSVRLVRAGARWVCPSMHDEKPGGNCIHQSALPPGQAGRRAKQRNGLSYSCSFVAANCCLHGDKPQWKASNSQMCHSPLAHWLGRSLALPARASPSQCVPELRSTPFANATSLSKCTLAVLLFLRRQQFQSATFQQSR